MDGERVKVGKITSVADDVSKSPVQHRALGYLKRMNKGNATFWSNESVCIGDDLIPAIVRTLPYLGIRSLHPEDTAN